MLDRLRIGPKLLLAPALVLVLLIVSSSGAYYTMVRQNQSFETIVEHRATRIKNANDLVGAAQQAHAKMYQLLAWIGGSFSAPRLDALVQDIHARHLEIDRKFARMTKNTRHGSAERRFLEQSEAAHAVYVLAILDVIEMSEVDHSISANAMSRAERAFDKVSARLHELAQLEQELSQQASHDAASNFQTVSVLMPVLVVISIILSLGVSMAVRNALLREVKEIGQSALDLANGNLTVKQRAYGRDEISETSRALDTSIRNLNLTLKTILDSAREIDSASREIAIGNAGLSSRTGAHASSLVRTSASMEKLSISVSKTADSAHAANRLTASASTIALESGTVVDRLVQTLASIKGSSHKVIEMIGVIDHLACQTSILALNAAVEAARVGETGRGFATTACEVRVLAQRSAVAARDIRELIAKSVAEIDGGSASAAQAGSSMANLASSVQEVGEIIGEISLSSAMQASGISDMSEAIVQLDQMTQKNSALVEQAAAAAESLQHQALNLSRAVAFLKLDEAPLLPPLGDDDGKRKRRAHLRLASKRA